MADLIFAAQFVTAQVGKTGLTVTVDVDRYTISDGSRTALVTGGAATEGRRGLYSYRLASADLATYQYVATFITTNTTVDQQEIPTLGLVVPDMLTSAAPPSASDNATAIAAAVLAAADVTPIRAALAASQGAVTFGQVKILANAPGEGALHIVNSHIVGTGRYLRGALYGEHNVATADSGIGTFNQATGTNSRGMANSGVLLGLQNYGGSADVDGVDPAGIRAAIGMAAADLDAQLGTLALETTAQAILEDTSTTLPGLIAVGVGPGSGTGYYTDTIDDGTSPLDGVRVQLYTAPDRVGPAYEAYTNALGVFEMWPDPGTYYRWLDYAGVSFAQDVAVVVTEP